MALDTAFFAREARKNNRRALCASALHEPATQVAMYKAKRAANIARARAYKDRDATRRQCRDYDAQQRFIEASCML